MNTTRQGVRNLNGPHMDGVHNGRRTSCPHFRAPDSVPQRKVIEPVRIESDVGPVTKECAVYYCSNCDDRLWSEADPS